MKCIACAKELEASMRHAISMNSCPFCGKNIFSAEEFDFRKSIYRILIKNGMENEEWMSNVVDDISAALRENIIKIPPKGDGRKAKPLSDVALAAVKQSVVEEEMAEEDDEDDGLGDVPSRVLTPDPNKTRATTTPTKADKVALAMREYEASQKIDDDDDKDYGSHDDNVTHGQDGADADDFFITEKTPEQLKAERLQTAAREARMKLIQESSSGFKNQPITRRAR